MEISKFSIAQSFIIACLAAFLIFDQCGCSKTTPLRPTIDGYTNDSTYTKTYTSQTIKELKKENKELYDKIKFDKNVVGGIMFYSIVEHKTDTVYVTPEENKKPVKVFKQDTGTISYELKIKADSIDWYKLDFKINNRFSLITKSDGDYNQLDIVSKQGTVSNVSVYTPKVNKSFWRNFAIGPQIGVGVLPSDGFKPTYYVGFGVTYNLVGKKR